MRRVILVQNVLNSEAASTIKTVSKIFNLDMNNPNFSSELSFLLHHEQHLEVYNHEIHSYVVKEGKKLLHTLKAFDLRTYITTKYPKGRDGRAIVVEPIDAFHQPNIIIEPNNLFNFLGYSCFNVSIDYEQRDNMVQPHTSHKIHLVVTSSLGIPCNPVLNISNRLIDYFPVEMHREINYGGEIINVSSQLVMVDDVL